MITIKNLCNAPTQAEWNRLFDAMDQVKELYPWNWMPDDALFGIQHSDSKDAWFVQVVQFPHESPQVIVYQGEHTYFDVVEHLKLRRLDQPEYRLLVPQLIAQLVSPSALSAMDNQIMTDVNRTYTGIEQPRFRAVTPGFVPWYLESEMAQVLTDALEQLLIVAPRLQDAPDLLTPEDLTLFFRVQEGTDWQDERRSITPPAPDMYKPHIDQKLIDKINMLSHRGGAEVDLIMMPDGVERDQSPPYYVFLLLVVGDNGMVLGTHSLKPFPSYQAMRQSIGNHLLDILAKMDSVPRRLIVRRGDLYSLLYPVVNLLKKIHISQSSQLPHLEPAKQSLLTQFS